jgi:uncharacterized membrane protein YfcA
MAADATHPSSSAQRTSRTHRPGGLLYLGVTALGIGGFVGALVASFYAPEWATTLRIVAFGWFVCISALRIALFWKR